MATPAGVTVTSVLGAGAQGTVRLGTVDPAVLGILRGWSHGPVAVKTWDREEDGAAVAEESIRSINALPGTVLSELVISNIVMPLSVHPARPAVIIMPVGVALCNRDWRHVIAATAGLLESGTNVVHMDVKAANLMWHDGTVKFIDHEALCVAGKRVAGMPSYSPWDWRCWEDLATFPSVRSQNPSAYDNAYFSAYVKIEALLLKDCNGAVATMLWGALCTAVIMTTGIGDPRLSLELVSELDCPVASRMYTEMLALFGSSAIGAAATELGAWRAPLLPKTSTAA